MYYIFESLQNMFGGYKNFRNKLQKETIISVDPYPSLEPDEPRRKIADKFLRVQ